MSDVEASTGIGKLALPEDAGVLSIGDGSGRVLLQINRDGTVEGAIEDAGDAAREFLKAIRSGLELLLSPTPTGDADALDVDPGEDAPHEFRRGFFAARETIRLRVAAGFRVTPEPVYEYGMTSTTPAGHTYLPTMTFCTPDDLDPNRVMRRTKGTKAGDWERLPVEGEKK